MQEVQSTPSMINTKKSTHIIFKLQKIEDKEKILEKGRRGKTLYLQKNKDKNYIEFSPKNK